MNEVKHQKRKSLKTRFIVMVSMLICLILVLVGIVINNQVREQVITQMKKRGEALAKNIAANSMEALLTGDELSLGVYVDKIIEEPSIIYAMILDDHGRVITHSNLKVKKGFQFEDRISLKSVNSEVPLIQDDGYSDEFGDYIDVTMPMKRGDSKIGLVRIGFSQQEIETASTRLRNTIFIIACVGLFGGIAITWVLVSRVIKPLRQLTRGVEIVGSGNLDFRINLSSQDELGQLANSFNTMTGKLKTAQQTLIEQERLKHELQIAQQIQASLLPREFPKVEGADVQAFYRAAKEVGGDYFDFINISPTQIGFVIADVSGKGVPGSLGMVVTRSIFRMQALTGGTAGEVLTRTNELVYQEIKRGIFVTIFYAILDIPLKRLNCASAGHNPPVLFHKEMTSWIKLDGLALGVDKGPIFNKTLKENTIQLTPGDIFLMYTDGVSEAMNLKSEEFGENRLASIVRRAGSLPLAECLKLVQKEIEQFVGNVPQSDDITIVGLKVR
ncbi:MAG: SpoIIE family protein phosphatase [bacterium]